MSDRRGNSIEHRGGVYDGRAGEWSGIDHQSPVESLNDLDLHTGEIPLEADDFSLPRECWKTLLRYVWHNARSVVGACVYFGIAARHVDPVFTKHMLPAEVHALNSEGTHKWNRTKKLLNFRDLQTWAPMGGYTPLAALLEGEHGEHRRDAQAQELRRSALRAIILAAWQDLQTRKWEETLRGAFKNFTALTAEDRDLLAWVTQTEFGRAFRETRAAFCARRKRRVKATLQLNGYTATTAPGGKSEGAIATYREVQKGNHNRRGAHKGFPDEDYETARERLQEHREAVEAMRVHDDIPVRPDLPRDPKALRKHLKALAEAAECKRLALLCHVNPEDIIIAKTRPESS